MVATRTAVEVLRCQPESARTAEMFVALARAARAHRVDVVNTPDYRGGRPWLMLWGPGAPDRAAIMREHVRRGGHVLAWDLAYWDRYRKLRVSVDAAHPQAWVMRQDLPASRFKADRVTVADRYKARGPVIIAGIGDKARVQYGADTVDAWEHAMYRACLERWPDRRVLYRVKKAHQEAPPWAATVSSAAQPIDQALNGVSLVITWHSNVAVDAIRLGIPVICRDGAAAAVCPSELGLEDPRPLDPAVRDRFLFNLAWFQWLPAEGAKFWGFVAERLS